MEGPGPRRPREWHSEFCPMLEGSLSPSGPLTPFPRETPEEQMCPVAPPVGERSGEHIANICVAINRGRCDISNTGRMAAASSSSPPCGPPATTSWHTPSASRSWGSTAWTPARRTTRGPRWDCSGGGGSVSEASGESKASGFVAKRGAGSHSFRNSDMGA